MWQFWLILAGFFIVLEIITAGFLVFWFSISALLTMFFSLFIQNIVIQIGIFVVFSTILLFATKSFVEKITKKTNNFKTNAYSIEGKLAKVIKPIDPIEGTGQIKLNGDVWSAKSYDDSRIDSNTEVIIEKIDGVKAIVKPLEKNIKN